MDEQPPYLRLSSLIPKEALGEARSFNTGDVITYHDLSWRVIGAVLPNGTIMHGTTHYYTAAVELCPTICTI